MTADPNQPGKTAVDKHAPSEINPATGAPHWPADYPSTGEIDLVDLGVLLWHRRWLMLIVFLVFLALTIIATVLKRPTYAYTTSLQLGTTTVQSSGNVVPLISAAAVAQAMRDTYIPQAIAQYMSIDRPSDTATLQLPKIIATGTSGGDSVVLGCDAKITASGPCVAIESIAAKNFITNHAQFVTGAKQQLASLQAQAKVLQGQMDKLNASTMLYQKREADLEKQLAFMQKAGVQAANNTGNSSTAIVLNTQMQSATDSLANVRQQLVVSIPQQIAQLSQQLTDNTRAQQVQEQAISQGFAQIVNPGLRSFKPVGLSRSAVLGIGILLSIILAFIAAFIAAYVQHVRARLLPQPGN